MQGFDDALNHHALRTCTEYLINTGQPLADLEAAFDISDILANINSESGQKISDPEVR